MTLINPFDKPAAPNKETATEVTVAATPAQLLAIGGHACYVGSKKQRIPAHVDLESRNVVPDMK